MELLIVLVILAIMTTVAITATDSLVDQGRYDATQRTLTNLEEAVLGSNQRDHDGTVAVRGFVADMGRLPRVVIDGGDPDEAGKRLRELWEPISTGLVPYGLYPVSVPATDLPEDSVAVPYGWRGPYLRLPTGTSNLLRDGWGNAFDVIHANGAFAANLEFANVVRSRGADNLVDAGTPAGYERDLYIPGQFSPLPATLATFGNRVLGSVAINVKVLNTTTEPPTYEDPRKADGEVVVRYFGPNPLTGVLGYLATKYEWQPADPEQKPVTLILTAPVGARLFRAHQGTVAPGLKKSSVHQVMIHPDGSPSRTLHLR